MREGGKVAQGEVSVSPSLCLCWLEFRVSPVLRNSETKDLQTCYWAHEFRSQSQGWNVLARHLASLASFEMEHSVSLTSNGEPKPLYYLWFQHAFKAPPAVGLRTLWGVHWLQGSQLEPLPGYFHRRARKCLCPLNLPPLAGCSAHHRQSGLERGSFPMISQATLEDNAEIVGRVSVLSDF